MWFPLQRRVHGPDLSFGEGKSRHTDMQQGRGIRSGTTLATLSQMHANAQWSPLRYPLLAPVAGEIQDLLRMLRDRERDHAVVYGVRILAEC